MNAKPESLFEQHREIDSDGVEFWSARKLAKILDYTEYRNFLPVVAKAKEACRNSGHRVEDHFVGTHEMVEIGSGARREMESLRLSRYACYLIVQNADSGKEVVALGQTYFAVQTRLRELEKTELRPGANSWAGSRGPTRKCNGLHRWRGDSR
jgi:DNA-damage-inducible protein D